MFNFLRVPVVSKKDFFERQLLCMLGTFRSIPLKNKYMNYFQNVEM
jgi:hypothetical protein